MVLLQILADGAYLPADDLAPVLAHDGTHGSSAATSRATLEMLKGTEDDRALYQQLRASWNEIFPSGNRNAAVPFSSTHSGPLH